MALSHTLSFKGATIGDLRKKQFIEAVLSFGRPRSASKELDVTFSTETNASAEKVYQAIFYGWPGSKNIEASNPGGAQRANSCAVQSVAKWVKGRYFENKVTGSGSNGQQNQQLPVYHTLTFWMKMTALSDYLNTHRFPIARVYDAVDQSERVQNPSLNAGINHEPAFGVDTKVLGDVSELSKRYVAPLMAEMGYRLNLLRAFPYCTSFDFEKDVASLDPAKDRKEFFTELATLCKYFYYTTPASSTLHPPDAFMGDLVNAWMIVFFESKKDRIIPDKVLLEWIHGMAIMLDHYRQEYVFDSPQSEKRFRDLGELCLKEKNAFLKNIRASEKEYSPIEDAWHISTEGGPITVQTVLGGKKHLKGIMVFHFPT